MQPNSSIPVGTKKDVAILKRGFFELPFMNSRIKTHSMTTKEKVLGYLVGPMGMAIFIAMYNALFELYYTQVFVMDTIYGRGTYQVMCMVGKAVGVAMGIVMGWLMDRTVSSQGKIRPYVFIGSMLAIFAGLFAFIIPFKNDTANLIYAFVMYVLYNGFAMSAYYLKVNIQTLATRNQKDRTQIIMFDRISAFMLTGMLISMMVSSFLYYIFLVNPLRPGNWILFMAIATVIAFPLIFVEYFYTKERLTLEDRKKHEAAGSRITRPSVKQQFKGLLTNKYWIMAFIMGTITTVILYFRGANVGVNYLQHVLGANAENNFALLYNLTAGLPMGIGLLAIYPLARKFSVRNVTIVSNIALIIGNIICLTAPRDPIMAIVGGFIVSSGSVANMYVFTVILQSANDAVENKSGFRPEGCFAVMVMAMLQNLIYMPFAGLYETILIDSGYSATLVRQPVATESFIIFMMYTLPIICYGLATIVLFFYDLEKKLPKIQKENLEAEKMAVLARGEEWVDPIEAERMEREENARLSEEARIADLKERCAKKGLDFESENQEYLNRINQKKQRKAARLARKAG